jgi:Ca2+-binding EF-hand superfamily protein
MQSHGHRYFVKSNDYFVTVTDCIDYSITEKRNSMMSAEEEESYRHYFRAFDRNQNGTLDFRWS